jgi:hypothetical protein
MLDSLKAKSETLRYARRLLPITVAAMQWTNRQIPDQFFLNNDDDDEMANPRRSTQTRRKKKPASNLGVDEGGEAVEEDDSVPACVGARGQGRSTFEGARRRRRREQWRIGVGEGGTRRF